MSFNRQNRNVLSSWWWTVDRYVLFAVLAIIAVGAIMITTASPAVAQRIGLDGFYFVRRQLVFLLLATAVIIGASLFSPVAIRRIAMVGFLIGLVLLVVVLFVGMEVKGARRWIYLAGISIQPSEFMKPFFIVLTAWILSKNSHQPLQAYKISGALYILLVTLLILQPDFGMVVTVSAVWGGQLFLAGLPLLLIAVFIVLGVAGVLGAYTFLPHVAQRINSFLDPAEESYQVKRSLDAFMNGGLFGRGPGEGTIKEVLPDSHTDFIFAVAGEEFGFIACLIIVALFAFVVVRSLVRAMQETDLFIVYSVAGLAMQFGLQAMINMGVTLKLLPAKGMTLPFISYGGSSLLAVAIAVGMLLAFTRKRYGMGGLRR